MIDREDDGWERRPSVFEAIEAELEKSLTSRRGEIESDLAERINREREEARKKVAEAEHEIAEVRRILEESRAVLADFNQNRERIQGLIADLCRRAMEGKRVVAQKAGEAVDALVKIDELTQELESVRARSEERTAFLRTHLEKRFGIKTRLERVFDVEEAPYDWRSEILRMKHIREIAGPVEEETAAGAGEAGAGEAGAEGTAGREAAGQKEEAAAGEPARVEETGAGTGEPAKEASVMSGRNAEPEIPAAEAGPARVPENAPEQKPEPEPEPKREPEGEPVKESGSVPLPEMPQAGATEDVGRPAAEAEPTEAAAGEPASQPEAPAGPEIESLRESLAGLRKTEPVAGGSELVYFERSGKMVLDAESLIDTMSRLATNAKELHAQLGKTGSLKDLFFIKQEILNQQEILRKVFYRAVKFCDKEGGALPEQLGDIVSAATIRDALERLTMGNWSNDDDFDSFMDEIATLKSAFQARTACPGAYLRSLLAQLA